MATKVLFSVIHYPKVDNNWEEKDCSDRTWKNLTTLYHKTDVKATLKQKAKGNLEPFGGSALTQKCSNQAGSHVRHIPITMDNI